MDDAALPDERPLYENAACGLLVTQSDGLIRRANSTFCGWLGYEADALVGRVKFQDLLTVGGRIFHQTHWSPLLQIQGSVAEVKLDVVRRDGRKMPMLLNAVRREHAGVARHELAVFIAEDRNQYERELLLARRRAEELLLNEKTMRLELSAAQEELARQRAVAEDRALVAEQMVGIVSHDLRNPLSVIRMSAHLLGMGTLSSNQHRALERLTNSTTRAGRMIADLLDFTQARLGRGLQIALKTIDLHHLVADSVEDLRLAFEGRQLVHLHSGQGPCDASSDRVVQLVGNLVANAITHGDAQSPVVVRSSVEDATFSISVHNQGQPIPEALLPTLFAPMTRGNGSDSTSQGVGLGLFIVREIVRAHGGSVTVTSSIDAGTTFVATFPRQGPAIAGPSEPLPNSQL